MLFCFIGHSQPLQTPIISYTHRHFTPQHGLPGLYINSLFQDHDGYLWIGTKSGLARYDGLSFKTWGYNDGVTAAGFWDIDQLPDGRIVVISNRGIYLISGDKVSPLYTDDRFNFYLQHGYVHDGEIYLPAIPKADRSAYEKVPDLRFSLRWDTRTKKFEVMDSVHGGICTPLPSGDCLLLEETADGAAQTALLLRKGKVVLRQGLKERFQLRWNKQAHKAGLLSQKDGRFYKVDVRDDSIHLRPTVSTASGGAYSHLLFQMTNGELLHSDANQVFLSAGGKAELLLTANNPNQAFEDREGALWLATEDGLFHFPRFLFQEYKFNATGDNDFIWSLGQTPDSLFWIASFTKGLWWYDRSRNKHQLVSYKDRDGSRKSFADLYYHPVMHRGSLYYGGGDQLLKIAGRKVNRLRAKGALSMFLYSDSVSGRVLSGGEGIHYLDGDTLKLWKSSTELGLNGMYVLAMCRDRLGRLWYSSTPSVGYIEKNGRVRYYNNRDVGAGLSMCCDKRGNLWFGGSSGLWFYDYNRLRKVSHPLLAGRVGSIYDYKGRYLLVSLSKGLIILDLAAFYRNPSAPQLNLYSWQNGYTGFEYSQNSLWEDLEGYMWANAPNTLLRFHPDSLQTTLPQPRARITSAEVSSDRVHWEGRSLKNHISLPSAYNNVRFSFGSIYFSYAGNILFQYRLKGFSDWSLASVVQDATYTNLAPGQYQFEARASLDGVRWQQAGSPVVFTVNPAWYQTWLARIGGAILLLLLGAWGLYYFTRRRRAATEWKLETLRLRLQSVRSNSLPHFSNNVLHNIDYLLADGKTDNARQYLAYMSRIITSNIAGSDQPSRSLEEELTNVTYLLKLEALRFEGRLQYDIHVAEGVDQSIQIPNGVLQTYSENAVKHGLAARDGRGTVNISIAAQAQGVLLQVTDNGIGRAAAARSPQFGTRKGLAILREQVAIFNPYNANKIVEEVTDMHDAAGHPEGTCFRMYVPHHFRYEIPEG